MYENLIYLTQLIGDFPMLFGDTPSKPRLLSTILIYWREAPIRQHPYRVITAKRAIMKKEVAYLLENILMRPSSSPWSSPCLLLPKSNDSPRFCTDFCKVNVTVTVPDYPMDGGLHRQYWFCMFCYRTPLTERLLAGPIDPASFSHFSHCDTR